MFNKKGIGPVVGSALLLVVAVVAVVGFQNWYTTFQSTTLVDIEEESSSSNSLQIQGLSYGNLYFKSSESNISSLRIISEKTGSEMCSFSGSGEINSSGLVGWWTLDDENSIIEDKSGNNNHGTLYGNTRLLLDFDDGTSNDKTAYQNNGTVNGATYTTSDCISGGCYQFDGIDDVINIQDNISLEPTNEFSISVWIKTSDLNAIDSGIIGKSQNNAGNAEYALTYHNYSTNYYIYSYVGDGSNNIRTDYFPDDKWHQIITSYDKNNFRIYLDGELKDNKSLDINISFTNSLLRIGDMTTFFNGSIDEVAIYSKALSDSEVKELYNLQKAKFIEFVDSPIDKAVKFDGIDDYIKILSNISSSLNNNLNITLISMFKTDYRPSIMFGSILFGVHNTSFGNLYRVGVANNGGIFLAHNNDVELGSNYDSDTQKILVINSQTSAYDYIYLNNVFLTNYSQPITNWDNSYYYSIGMEYDAVNIPSDFFKGSIDEIRIYNRTLSEEEIEQLYFYSIKQTDESTNSIDLSSCNLKNNQPYQIQLFTNEGSVIESRFNN